MSRCLVDNNKAEENGNGRVCCLPVFPHLVLLCARLLLVSCRFLLSLVPSSG